MASADSLSDIYRELDALFAGSNCPRSTRCCRFRQTGRTPYVTPPEAEGVLRAIDRRGGRLPKAGEEGDCPLLLTTGGCSIYADRPFGCRTYFCDDATLPEGSRRQEVDRLAQRVRALAELDGRADPVPLTTILRGAFGRDGRRLKGPRQGS